MARKTVARSEIRRKRRHPREGSKGAGYFDVIRRRQGPRRRECQILAACRDVILQMPRQRFPVSGQKVQYRQTLRRRRALLGGSIGSLQKLVKPAIGLAGARIVMPLQKLGIGAQRNGVARSSCGSLSQIRQSLLAVPAAFQAPSLRGQVLAGCPGG